MLALSAAVHRNLRRCGGFMFHTSEAEGIAAVSAPKQRSACGAGAAVVCDRPAERGQSCWRKCRPVISAESRYVLVCQPLLHHQQWRECLNWLKQRWTTMAAGRSDIAVTQYTHSGWPQKS
jgi:leucyl aminopeptidase